MLGRGTRRVSPGSVSNGANPSEAAVLVLAVNSATLPLSDVDEYAETTT
jgi:hypothetical protein